MKNSVFFSKTAVYARFRPVQKVIVEAAAAEKRGEAGQMRKGRIRVSRLAKEKPGRNKEGKTEDSGWEFYA